MVPNLNKWKYIKLHRKKRLINLGKGNKGKAFSVYSSGVQLKKSTIITIKQFDSVRKFINKKLKAKDRVNRKNHKILQEKKKFFKQSNKERTVIYRSNFNLGLTKKPLQVRMGKGKGAPVDWVYPCAKNRMFLEFVSKKVKYAKLIRILKKASKKLPVKTKILTTRIQRRIERKKFNSISAFIDLKCVKEL